ncbi:MAG: hypothetical protein ACI9YL_001110 [Luteibaculaceae bacterium]|jgi:hypothetical protein
MKGLLVLAFSVFSLGIFAQSNGQESIKVETSSVNYVKVKVGKEFLGGDYFITDTKGVMVAIGKLRNKSVEYFPEFYEAKQLVFNAVNKVKGISASRDLFLK